MDCPSANAQRVSQATTAARKHREKRMARCQRIPWHFTRFDECLRLRVQWTMGFSLPLEKALSPAVPANLVGTKNAACAGSSFREVISAGRESQCVEKMLFNDRGKTLCTMDAGPAFCRDCADLEIWTPAVLGGTR